MLGLCRTLPKSVRTTILCFRDHASSAPFLEELRAAGINGRVVGHTNPHFLRMIADVAAQLERDEADLLVCHGYKADFIGWFAARRVGVPVIAVSRGWTAHTSKVRAYEALDRRMLRRMDAVVCVSAGQAAKVARAGVQPERLHVVHNSVDTTRFRTRDAAARVTLEGFFAVKPSVIVVAIGRLSPEKGFDQLIDAASMMVDTESRIGIVLIGDGPERSMLEQSVRRHGLESTIVFAGFRNDVDQLLPAADILAQSSHTEGLPNVVLEACAAAVPVVATDVGGTREIIDDGVNGFLIPAANASALAGRLANLVRSPELRRQMGERGRELVRARFSFARQAEEYQTLFAGFVPAACPVAPSPQFIGTAVPSQAAR